jgi:cytochrome c5
MKKIILTLVFALVSVNAQTPSDIFTSKCVACHQENMPTEMTKEIKAKLLAPPMAKVSMKLKQKFKTQKEFVAFVTDYITNPSKEKALCNARAVKGFGLMPPIGKSMTNKAKEDIANWLYTNFKSKGKACGGKDGNHCSGKKCGEKSEKKMKCGNGKCGGK